MSGVPLMLSVFRCGFSFKFVGRDQEACWAHRGYCYEFEASKSRNITERRVPPYKSGFDAIPTEERNFVLNWNIFLLDK